MAKQSKTTRRPKKHKPATLKYTIHNFEDYEKITADDKTKAFIYFHLINAVKTSISNNTDSVELFNLIDFNSTLSLKKEDWKHSLNKAVDFFADKELYEKAAECRDLISLL